MPRKYDRLKEKDVPRKGNVDRNTPADNWSYKVIDVPRKGNVDRNNAILSGEEGGGATFPARGTWIEMSMTV